MLTDTAIRKWTPTSNDERKRCGDGLYIRGFRSGRKLFQIRASVNGKRRWIDLGEYPARKLADAREAALAAKRTLKLGETSAENLQAALLRGAEPAELVTESNRGAETSAGRLGVPTFDQAFRDWYGLQIKANTWRHSASARFPLSAYETHVEKHIGNLRMDKITRPMLKKFMQPLFLTNSETARKILGYMHKVFETAYDSEQITGNPVPQKQSFTVPKRKIKHSASLHHARLPEIWAWLSEAPYSPAVKSAMQLAIISCHRASVVANMRWQHFDCDSHVWTVPEAPVGISQGYMKSGNAYSIRLPQALSEAVCTLPRKSDFVFTVDGHKAINAETLRRNFQKFDKVTTHGFRNSFKTWALNQEPAIDAFLVDRYCDHALAGLDKNYRRDDLFEQRATLAQRYFDYVSGGD